MFPTSDLGGNKNHSGLMFSLSKRNGKKDSSHSAFPQNPPVRQNPVASPKRQFFAAHNSNDICAKKNTIRMC